MSRSITLLGCGYLGSEIARKALLQGFSVHALTRNPQQAENLRNLGVTNVVIEQLDSARWHNQIPPHQDLVINCVSSAGGGLPGYRQSYLDGQESIMEWATRGQINTFIYTGTTSIYSQHHGELINENDLTNNLSPSGEILLQAEQIIQRQAPPSILRWFILRLGGLYGPSRHHLLDTLRRGETTFPGTGNHYLNLVHRDDCVDVLFSIYNAPQTLANRIYNLTDGHHATKAEVVTWLATQLSLPPPVFDPSMTQEREGRRRNPQGQLPNRRISIQRIQQELAWQPRYPSYREGYASLLSQIHGVF